MKYVFNVLLAFVVIWIIWSVIDHDKKDTSPELTHIGAEDTFDGTRRIETCRNKFSKPIAVEFYNDEMFVSNIVSSSKGSDSSGFVCRTNLYGDVVGALDTPELTSPKGMAEKNGVLYIADIDRLIEYDIDLDSTMRIIKIKGAKSLCDVEADRLGNVYISDTQNGCIYKLKGDTAVLFTRDTLCQGIMGLCSYDHYLYAGADDRIIRIDEYGHVRTLAHTTYPVYGIRADGDGNFITTDFDGTIYATNLYKTQTIISKRNGMNAAMIGYMPEQRRLVVPTYNDNSVELYEIGKYLQ